MPSSGGVDGSSSNVSFDSNIGVDDLATNVGEVHLGDGDLTIRTGVVLSNGFFECFGLGELDERVSCLELSGRCCVGGFRDSGFSAY